MTTCPIAGSPTGPRSRGGRSRARKASSSRTAGPGRSGGGATTWAIFYDGDWYPVWKNSNPFGVVMADLFPGIVELHGTGKDETGADAFPEVTHGCVRTYNRNILAIMHLAPPGTKVTTE